MSNDLITCPKCNAKFAASDAITSKLRTELQDEMDEKIDTLKETHLLELREAASKAKAAAIEAVKKEGDARMADLAQQVKEQEAKLALATANEVELRHQARELEAGKKELELTVARRIDQERERVRSEATMAASEEHQLKAAEWAKQRSDMEGLIATLKQKAEQGSQQGQGESFELSVEDALRTAFPQDEVVPVEKGVSGADLALRVKGGGTIIFELKRTKAFSPSWLAKLRDDQRAAKADLAVLISTVLPDDVKHVGQQDGVWLASPSAFLGLAQALRAGLQEATRARASKAGRASAAEVVFDYVHGVEFQARVMALAEVFVSMREGIETERRAYEKIWSRRDKELARALTATAGMWGDLQGLGAPLKDIPQLGLEVEA